MGVYPIGRLSHGAHHIGVYLVGGYPVGIYLMVCSSWAEIAARPELQGEIAALKLPVDHGYTANAQENVSFYVGFGSYHLQPVLFGAEVFRSLECLPYPARLS